MARLDDAWSNVPACEMQSLSKKTIRGFSKIDEIRCAKHRVTQKQM